MPRRSSRPSASINRDPKVSAMAASPGVPRTTTSRAATSASYTAMPRASKERLAALLPDAMPPVRATVWNVMTGEKVKWNSLQTGHASVGTPNCRAEDEPDPAGRSERNAEGNLRGHHVPALDGQQRDRHQQADQRRHQRDRQQCERPHPRAQGSQQLEVAVAHAFLAGGQLEQPVEAP